MTYAFHMNSFNSYSADLDPNINLDSSETPDMPSGTSKYDPPSTSQLTCNLLDAVISVHNIV